jgi:hypothetical protein
VQYYKKLLAEKIMLFADVEEVDYIEVHKRPEPVSEATEETSEEAATEAVEEKAGQQSDVGGKKETQSPD